MMFYAGIARIPVTLVPIDRYLNCMAFFKLFVGNFLREFELMNRLANFSVSLFHCSRK